VGIRGKRGRAARAVVIQVPLSDARPASEKEPSRNAAERLAARERRFHRRVVLAVLGAVFLGGTVTALFGEGGYFALRRLRGRLAVEQARLVEEQARVEALRDEVEHLRSDPMARERIAREELGLTRPGEVTYVLTDELSREGAPAGEGGAN